MGVLAAESAGMECGRRRYAGRRRRSVGSRLAAKAKAVEAMVVAARSMEVVMEVKGTAVMVAAEEEAAKEESAVAEVRRCRRACGLRVGASRRPRCVSCIRVRRGDESGASCSKRSCRATCCAEEHHGKDVSMVSGRMMAFISARAFGKDEDAGVGEAGWERADEGFVVKTMMRVAAGASWALRPRWEDEGGGATRRRDDIFSHKWVVGTGS